MEPGAIRPSFRPRDRSTGPASELVCHRGHRQDRQPRASPAQPVNIANTPLLLRFDPAQLDSAQLLLARDQQCGIRSVSMLPSKLRSFPNSNTEFANGICQRSRSAPQPRPATKPTTILRTKRANDAAPSADNLHRSHSSPWHIPLLNSGRFHIGSRCVRFGMDKNRSTDDLVLKVGIFSLNGGGAAPDSGRY